MDNNIKKDFSGLTVLYAATIIATVVTIITAVGIEITVLINIFSKKNLLNGCWGYISYAILIISALLVLFLSSRYEKKKNALIGSDIMFSNFIIFSKNKSKYNYFESIVYAHIVNRLISIQEKLNKVDEAKKSILKNLVGVITYYEEGCKYILKTEFIAKPKILRELINKLSEYPDNTINSKETLKELNGYYSNLLNEQANSKKTLNLAAFISANTDKLKFWVNLLALCIICFAGILYLNETNDSQKSVYLSYGFNSVAVILILADIILYIAKLRNDKHNKNNHKDNPIYNS